MIKLKLCPFCGGEAALLEKEYANIIQCTQCKAEGPIYDVIDEEYVILKNDVIRVWNTRVNDEKLKSRLTDESDVPGVTFIPEVVKWVAEIEAKGELINLGVFYTKQDAEQAVIDFKVDK